MSEPQTDEQIEHEDTYAPELPEPKPGEPPHADPVNEPLPPLLPGETR